MACVAATDPCPVAGTRCQQSRWHRGRGEEGQGCVCRRGVLGHQLMVTRTWLQQEQQRSGPGVCTWVLTPPLGANRGLRGGWSGWGCSQSPKGTVRGTRQDIPKHLPCAGQRALRSPGAGAGLQGTTARVRTWWRVPGRNNARGIAEIQRSEGAGHGGCNWSPFPRRLYPLLPGLPGIAPGSGAGCCWRQAGRMARNSFPPAARVWGRRLARGWACRIAALGRGSALPNLKEGVGTEPPHSSKWLSPR